MHDTLWQAVLGEIELSVSHGNYVTWFKNTKLVRNKDNIIIIGVGNIFIKQQLEGKFNQLIMDVLKKNGVQPERVEFKINTSAPAKKAESSDDSIMLSDPAPTRNKDSYTQPPAAMAQSSNSQHYRQGLNEKYTFESFIVGSGNELAYAACQAIAENPGKKYNPLFLYGGVGIGKTHLMQAVGNGVLARNNQARIVYVTSEQFVREFLEAIRFKKNTDFAGYYRSADVLIIDDIQFIAGKQATQEEFFHTFNTLHQANKQIIISSDKPPKEIPTLEERLRSRFAWGMSIDMQAPNFETRCAIIQAKAQTHGADLGADVVEYLATQVQTNIRELEGALNQLLAFCEMRNIQPDIQVATSLFGGNKTRPKHISAKHIVERTAKYFQLPIEDLVGPKRDKDIVVPRQIAMYLLRSELHLSFPKIAHELGRKDHTTAIHSIEKIEREYNLDNDIREHVSAIKDRLYA